MDSRVLYARALCGARRDIARTIESAGGKLEAFYFAFGDADFYIIFDVPDNISAAALSVVANQSGFVTSKIIVLMSADEMDQAFKAMTVEFLPPGELTCVFELIASAQSQAPSVGASLPILRPSPSIWLRVP